MDHVCLREGAQEHGLCLLKIGSGSSSHWSSTLPGPRLEPRGRKPQWGVDPWVEMQDLFSLLAPTQGFAPKWIPYWICLPSLFAPKWIPLSERSFPQNRLCHEMGVPVGGRGT